MQPVASTINTLAGALYKVFRASPDQARKEMRQACFDYLSLGGIFSNGPISLLSGLNPKPLSLVLHFFAVAIYGVGRLLLPFPSPARLWIGARLISVCLASLSYLIPEKNHNTLSLYVSLWLDWVNFLDVIFLLQGASGIIFPIIKAEGVRKMFFPAIVPAYYRAPPVKSWPLNWLTHWKSRGSTAKFIYSIVVSVLWSSFLGLKYQRNLDWRCNFFDVYHLDYDVQIVHIPICISLGY